MDDLLIFLASVLLIIVILVALQFVKILWLTPKKLEKCLKAQGFQGNSYHPIQGDLSEINYLAKSALSKPISSLSHDITSRISPFFDQTMQKYGKESFMWYGRNPRINITKPELIREIFSKYEVYHKLSPGGNTKFGLVMREGEDWAKVRRIINPAFHMDKLKNMLSTMEICCDILIDKWEEMVKSSSAEVDVYSTLNTLTGDVIARTAFGSSYEEGKRLFMLQDQTLRLTFQTMRSIYYYIPGWRYVPSKTNQRKKALDREIEAIVKDMVDKRKRSTQTGDNKYKDDLLSIILESNEREKEEHGVGLPIEEVVDECKLFLLAGKDTTAALITWTMVLLSQHQDWQNKAREEVLLHFGNDKSPNYETLQSLKIVNMIINETLRFYPPVTSLSRTIHQNNNLKELYLQHGTEFNLPTILLHRDPELWGDDADTFNPSRFSEGVLSATKVPGSFIPFGGGPRVCIGQNFALVEAKLALVKILQRFTFEISPSYVHAPMCLAAMVPQFGAPLILHKI